MTRSQFLRAMSLVLLPLAFLPNGVIGQEKPISQTKPRSGTAEQRASHALDAARGNPLDLRAFLVAMPKGGDLHVHLGGAIYAETFIHEGAEDRLCVNTASLSFVKRQGSDCASGDVPAEKALHDQHLFDALVDSFSMRGFVPSAGTTGHDQFFNTFGRFAMVDSRHTGEWLDEVASRAAVQNEQYLELMVTPDFTRTAIVSRQLGWHPGGSMSEFRDQLLSHGLRDDVAVARAYVDQAEADQKRMEHCGEPQQLPACSVKIRYIYQVLRAFPPEQVFAQTLLGFETISADPRFVGINYVQPEDDHTAMSDYALHMRMLSFLHDIYPKAHISLHAGELAPGMVPPDGLCCHIRMAIETAHAERIGHGVDVMQEDHPYELLKEMAERQVMVEINLTSNDVILGISGKAHPLPIYRRFGVPVALSTDDEGVSRIDLTHEYVRAVETYGLSYPDLKQMVRTSIEHNFLPGESLWLARDRFRKMAPPCASDEPAAVKPSATCASFLGSSEKAQQEWELERRFAAFEASR